MAAYVIAELNIFDIEHYLAYQHALRPLLDAAGARYLVRGGESRLVTGEPEAGTIMLIAFPSLAAIDDFYQSEGYLALEPQRQACCDARIIAANGL
jgi:uncharacterized protein (DUF1330 family)